MQNQDRKSRMGRHYFVAPVAATLYKRHFPGDTERGYTKHLSLTKFAMPSYLPRCNIYSPVLKETKLSCSCIKQSKESRGSTLRITYIIAKSFFFFLKNV